MVANVIFRMGGAAIAFTNKPSACARGGGGEGGRGELRFRVGAVEAAGVGDGDVNAGELVAPAKA
jgi:hypothetical protein